MDSPPQAGCFAIPTIVQRLGQIVQWCRVNLKAASQSLTEQFPEPALFGGRSGLGKRKQHNGHGYPAYFPILINKDTAADTQPG